MFALSQKKYNGFVQYFFTASSICPIIVNNNMIGVWDSICAFSSWPWTTNMVYNQTYKMYAPFRRWQKSLVL